jgi:hypothetical protein
MQVRLVQKTDTGKIYAMKTLKKEEMLKKDQVCLSSLWHSQKQVTESIRSWRMSVRSAMFWLNPTPLGWFSYFIPSRTHKRCISSWSFSLAATS